MKMSFVVGLCLACSTEPAPSASVQASGPEAATREGAEYRREGSDAATPPAVSSSPSSGPHSSGPAPGGSSTPAATWSVAEPGPWLVGRWVSEKHGDAIPGGPKGGTIVAGGVRAEFVKGRPGSKTPWNLIFWAPTSGHLGSKTISGGCGFYPSGVAFCRGYGLPVSQRPHETRIALMIDEQDPPNLQFVVTDLVASGALKKVLP